jgi:hypothetical protein
MIEERERKSRSRREGEREKDEIWMQGANLWFDLTCNTKAITLSPSPILSV